MISKLSLTLIGALLCLNATSASNTTSCHDYVLVNVRGTFEHQGPSIAFKNMTANTLSKITNGTEYDLVYPANATAASYAEGGTNLKKYINDAVAACPKQKYAILGYSQGASVTTLAINTFASDSAAFKAIEGVLVVGNPSHKPYQSSNYDETGNLTTRGYLGSAYSGGLRIAPYWYQSTKVIDICHTDDIVCLGGSSVPGANIVAHLKYGSSQTVQEIGTNFLIGSLTPMLA